MCRLFKFVCGLSPFLGTLRIDNGNGDANTAKETGDLDNAIRSGRRREL